MDFENKLADALGFMRDPLEEIKNDRIKLSKKAWNKKKSRRKMASVSRRKNRRKKP